MYNDGIGAAIFIGLIALALPLVWGGWWFLASLGERAGGRRPA